MTLSTLFNLTLALLDKQQSLPVECSHMPGMVLNALRVFAHLILMTALSHRENYYPHGTDKDIKTLVG